MYIVQITILHIYLIKMIHSSSSISRRPPLRLQQSKRIQELLTPPMVMTTLVRPVTVYAQRVRPHRAIEALDAREESPRYEDPTALAQRSPTLDDVIKGQHFPEIQAPVSVPVEIPEEVRVREPRVALVFHQRQELVQANPTVLVGV